MESLSKNKINNKDELLTKENISNHVDLSIKQIKKLMYSYLDNPDTASKADKLAYWLEDYNRLLTFEDSFNPTFLKKYKRGDIIKVNLGYNIGNEEGGLHYCVVVDKNNSQSSGIITVIPLTSYKGKDLHFSSVFLGDEIYKNFKEKYNKLLTELSQKINSVNVKTSTSEEIKSALDDLTFIRKMDSEMLKMKKGSIALVSQITTISKQKIYDPKKNKDVLSGLRLSDESLDLINNKLKKLYIK